MGSSSLARPTGLETAAYGARSAAADRHATRAAVLLDLPPASALGGCLTSAYDFRALTDEKLALFKRGTCGWACG